MNPTTDTQDLKAALLDDYDRRAGAQAPTALDDRRRAALDRFRTLPFPTLKDEEWKYTSLGQVLKTAYDLQQGRAESALARRDLAGQFDDPDADVLLFVNGHFEPRLSRIHSPGHELTILNLPEAIEKNEPAVMEHFGKIADDEAEVFAALNTAFATGGAFLHVRAGQAPQRPVVLHFVADARRAHLLAQVRNLIVVERGASLRVVENFTSLGEQTSFTNAVTEVYVAENARCDYYKLQQDAPTAHHVGTTHVQQRRDSHFDGMTVTTRGGVIRNNLNLTLDGENCEGHMYGLYLLNGRTHCDNHTYVDHKLPNSYSNELYKGVLDDRATGVFNGKIFVRQDAQKTNAFQSNRNLLLSDRATINTKPQLEIWADDVKCSHGATTGQLDEEALFYLRTRGLDAVQARALLLRAFAADVLDKATYEPLRDYLHGWLDERLNTV
ncbi:MAG: Fe-S cluster assembly protein SufD [Catalinimonas sp.]